MKSLSKIILKNQHKNLKLISLNQLIKISSTKFNYQEPSDQASGKAHTEMPRILKKQEASTQVSSETPISSILNL